MTEFFWVGWKSPNKLTKEAANNNKKKKEHIVHNSIFKVTRSRIYIQALVVSADDTWAFLSAVMMKGTLSRPVGRNFEWGVRLLAKLGVIMAEGLGATQGPHKHLSHMH